MPALAADTDGVKAGPIVVDTASMAPVLPINAENYTAPLREIAALPGNPAGLEGRYACDETGAELEIRLRAGACQARFSGPLGRGLFEPVQPLSADLWQIRTACGLDAPAPGDWTMQVERGPEGEVIGLTLDCLLARGLCWRRL